MSEPSHVRLGTFVMRENGTFEVVEPAGLGDAAKPAVLSESDTSAEQRAKKRRIRKISDRRRAQNRIAQRSYREKQKRRLQELSGDTLGSSGRPNAEDTIFLDPSDDQLQNSAERVNVTADSSAPAAYSAGGNLLNHTTESWEWPDTIDDGYIMGGSGPSFSTDHFYDAASMATSLSVLYPDTNSPSKSVPFPYHPTAENMAPLPSLYTRILPSRPKSISSRDYSSTVLNSSNSQLATDFYADTTKMGRNYSHYEGQTYISSVHESEISSIGYSASNNESSSDIRSNPDPGLSYSDLSTTPTGQTENNKVLSEPCLIGSRELVYVADLRTNHIRINFLNLLGAFLANLAMFGVIADRQECHIQESLFSQKYKACGEDAAVAMASFAHIKPGLYPTTKQLTKTHTICIDLFPFPKFRDRLIETQNLPPHVFNENEFIADMSNDGIWCWGTNSATGSGTPWDSRSWEIRPWFLLKWSMIIGGRGGEMHEQCKQWAEWRGERI